MNGEILVALNQLERERGISVDDLIEALKSPAGVPKYAGKLTMSACSLNAKAVIRVLSCGRSRGGGDPKTQISAEARKRTRYKSGIDRGGLGRQRLNAPRHRQPNKWSCRNFVRRNGA